LSDARISNAARGNLGCAMNARRALLGLASRSRRLPVGHKRVHARLRERVRRANTGAVAGIQAPTALRTPLTGGANCETPAPQGATGQKGRAPMAGAPNGKGLADEVRDKTMR
jgi:hypothetical protein